MHGAVPRGIGGRTHSMVQVGNCMLLFGGGADVSSALGFLKLDTELEFHWVDKNVTTVGDAPRRRISHCAVLAGRYMVSIKMHLLHSFCKLRS